MSKLRKLISSALNNSNANEAAQALKVAASLMQSEGINPSSVLQDKVSQDYFNSINNKQLREAEELAIKWRRVATAQEEQIRELVVTAVEAQESVLRISQDVFKYKKIARALGFFFAISLTATLVQYSLLSDQHYEVSQLKNSRDDMYRRAENLQKELKDLKSKFFALNSKPAVSIKPSVKPQSPGITSVNQALGQSSGIYSLKSSCKFRGIIVHPVFRINTIDSTSSEVTNLLAGVYNLYLPSGGAPAKGHNFKIRFSNGDIAKCKVTNMWE